ncbi:MAG TPA: hypothetical protein VKA38_01660 [Draconibacterium sp.]|nr:hypothetical protein [Draconibacterium sp.]
MTKRNTYRIFIWIIAILLATNLSMGISFIYHKQQDKQMIENMEDAAIEVPAQRRTRFFREQLNLRFDQMDTFRTLNRTFNRTAWDITHQLEFLRIEMVTELGKDKPSNKRLDSIANKIGKLHIQLKEETIKYYLGMRNECDEAQRKKLNEIFMSMLKQNENVKLPEYGKNLRNNN